VYNPSLFEVAFWAMPVSVSVTVTDAPAMRAPVESVTCPESDAFAVWAFRAFGTPPINTQAHIAKIRFLPFVRQPVPAFMFQPPSKAFGSSKDTTRSKQENCKPENDLLAIKR
jgi:hypothetical protein